MSLRCPRTAGVQKQRCSQVNRQLTPLSGGAELYLPSLLAQDGSYSTETFILNSMCHLHILRGNTRTLAVCLKCNEGEPLLARTVEFKSLVVTFVCFLFTQAPHSLWKVKHRDRGKTVCAQGFFLYDYLFLFYFTRPTVWACE